MAKRKPPVMRELVEGAGFEVVQLEEREFALRFADAAALFEHFFMRLAFVPAWVELVGAEQRGRERGTSACAWTCASACACG